MRGRRVAESIKHHLTQAFVRELGDRRFENVVITQVDLPDDLGVAWVSVRLLVGDDDERQRKTALKALGHVAARVRRSLAPKLRLKRVPELRFAYDTGLDHSRRVDEILREIALEGVAGEDVPADAAPVDTAPVDTAPVDTASADTAPVEPNETASGPDGSDREA
jgi:ribosome-binding factor A